MTHDNGDRVQAAPPGGKNFKKPVPPPKTRAPSGVQIRKQSSTERKAPLRKQNSTSFTTEDLDLFQSKFPNQSLMCLSNSVSEHLLVSYNLLKLFYASV